MPESPPGSGRDPDWTRALLRAQNDLRRYGFATLQVDGHPVQLARAADPARLHVGGRVLALVQQRRLQFGVVTGLNVPGGLIRLEGTGWFSVEDVAGRAV